MAKHKEKQEEPIYTFCENCGAHIDLETTHSCIDCGATLCKDCICEKCES